MNIQQAFLNISSRIPVEDINVKKRLDRGYEIARQHRDGEGGYGVSHAVSTNGEYVWYVTRASTSLFDDNTAMYTINDEGCNCPDAEKCRAGLCKHRLAVMLIKEMSSE